MLCSLESSDNQILLSESTGRLTEARVFGQSDILIPESTRRTTEALTRPSSSQSSDNQIFLYLSPLEDRQKLARHTHPSSRLGRNAPIPSYVTVFLSLLSPIFGPPLPIQALPLPLRPLQPRKPFEAPPLPPLGPLGVPIDPLPLPCNGL